MGTQLNHRVTLQRRSSAAGPLGQVSATWQTVDTVWADVQPIDGREFFADGQMQSSADARITIRYRGDVLASWRAMFRGVPYAIVGEPINVGGESEYLELMCETGVGDGR